MGIEGKSNHTPIVIDETCSPHTPQDSVGTETTDDDRKPEANTGYRTKDMGTDEAEDTDDDDTLTRRLRIESDTEYNYCGSMTKPYPTSTKGGSIHHTR